MKEYPCHCGERHRFSKSELEQVYIECTRGLEPDVTVIVEGRTWKVPRIFIAFHGLYARDLPYLGFEEITYGKEK